MSETPVYMLVQMDITDKERFFAEYAGPSQPIQQKHGVEVLAGAPEVNVLEGNYDKNFTVLLKFPSAQAHKEWYSDPDYQPLKDIRRQTTNPENTTLLVIPQFVPPHD